MQIHIINSSVGHYNLAASFLIWLTAPTAGQVSHVKLSKQDLRKLLVFVTHPPQNITIHQGHCLIA